MKQNNLKVKQVQRGVAVRTGPKRRTQKTQRETFRGTALLETKQENYEQKNQKTKELGTDSEVTQEKKSTEKHTQHTW